MVTDERSLTAAVARLRADGFVIIPEVFTDEEARTIREAVLANGAEQREILSVPGLEWLVTDPRVVEIARAALGDDPVYFFESSCTVDVLGWSWHRDNRMEDRFAYSGEDWQVTPFPIVKFAVYPQDHLRHSEGLALRRGSHLPRSDRAVGRRVLRWIGRGLHRIKAHDVFLFLPTVFDGQPVHADSSSRDLIVWYPTTTHAGNTRRLRWMPNRKLPPVLERVLPGRCFLPGWSGERCMVTWLYSDRSECAQTYYDTVCGRTYYQVRLDNAGRTGHDRDPRLVTADHGFGEPALTSQP